MLARPFLCPGSVRFGANCAAMNGLGFVRIDHIALAMPAGEEPRARDFYCGVLGMRELQKPPKLATRGGAWFQSGDVQIHLGVDKEFRAAKKAHPAIRVSDYDAFVARMQDASVTVTPDGTFVDGSPHCYVDDPFGNRIEFIATPVSS